MATVELFQAYIYYEGKQTKLKRIHRDIFSSLKFCGAQSEFPSANPIGRASYLTCVPFITTGVVSLKIHFQPSVYVCALYIPPCQTCCYAKANLLDFSPIREREKLKKKRENFRSPLDARHFCCSCCAPLNCLDRHKVDAYIFYFS